MDASRARKRCDCKTGKAAKREREEEEEEEGRKMGENARLIHPYPVCLSTFGIRLGPSPFFPFFTAPALAVAYWKKNRDR